MEGSSDETSTGLPSSLRPLKTSFFLVTLAAYAISSWSNSWKNVMWSKIVSSLYKILCCSRSLNESFNSLFAIGNSNLTFFLGFSWIAGFVLWTRDANCNDDRDSWYLSLGPYCTQTTRFTYVFRRLCLRILVNFEFLNGAFSALWDASWDKHWSSVESDLLRSF